MRSKESVDACIEQILETDRRYPETAYRFVLDALTAVITSLPDPRHVSGRELCYGCRDMAIEEFGPLARTVLEHWNIRKTEDFGEIVFNLVERGLLAKTENDSRGDFAGVFDFDSAFNAGVTDGGTTQAR
jgi:uncharacterized repeat protein (TIGR04138 family)